MLVKSAFLGVFLCSRHAQLIVPTLVVIPRPVVVEWPRSGERAHYSRVSHYLPERAQYFRVFAFIYYRESARIIRVCFVNIIATFALIQERECIHRFCPRSPHSAAAWRGRIAHVFGVIEPANVLNCRFNYPSLRGPATSRRSPTASPDVSSVFYPMEITSVRFL